MTARFLLLPCALWLAAAAAAQPADPFKDLFFPPDLILSNQTAIGLTDEQRQAIQDEVAELKNRTQEAQRQLADAAQALLAAIKQSPVDEAQALAEFDKVLSAERQAKRAQMSLAIHIRNKLTAEQQAQLQKIRASRKP
jgi:Spy/CpxP family protein refolding chaperone